MGGEPKEKTVYFITGLEKGRVETFKLTPPIVTTLETY